MRTLAQLLGVPANMIQVAHQQGFLPEPPKVSGRGAYDLEDVLKIAQYFGVDVSHEGDQGS
jgi:hypothetical protein